MSSRPCAFFDANVFYGARLRSFVMEAARSGLFRARWSERVHDEWIDALLARRPDLRREQLASTREAMNRAVPDCLVSGYEALVPGLALPDRDDRHVLAAAIVGRCDVIVTFNLKDFPAAALAPYAITARHPDEFFVEADATDPGALVAAAARDLAHYRNPPLTPERYADDLRTAGCPALAEHLMRKRIALTP